MLTAEQYLPREERQSTPYTPLYNLNVKYDATRNVSATEFQRSEHNTHVVQQRITRTGEYPALVTTVHNLI